MDKVTRQVIITAAYTASGDLDKAINYQDDAEGLDFDTSEIELRLLAYKKKQTWF